MPLYFQKGQNLFLKEQGFDISLISNDDNFLNEVKDRDGISIFPFKINRRISFFSDIILLINLICVIIKIKPDIVHAGSPKSAIFGMLAAFICRVKVRFYACHGSKTDQCQGFTRKVYRLIEKFTAFLSTKVWCVSPSLLEFIVSERIVSKDKVFTLGQGSANGFKREWLQCNVHDIPDIIKTIKIKKSENYFPLILFSGRICCVKGIEILTKAWLKLRERFPDARLMLIGSIDEVDPPPNINLLRDDDRVILPGLINQGESGRCYEIADLLVLPSFYGEGFGNVLGEAGLFALPTVASNIIGLQDAVIDGVTGTLVPPGDADSLYEAISNYLDNPELAKTHGLAARERYETYFKPELIWNGLCAEYKNLFSKT